MQTPRAAQLPWPLVARESARLSPQRSAPATATVITTDHAVLTYSISFTLRRTAMLASSCRPFTAVSRSARTSAAHIFTTPPSWVSRHPASPAVPPIRRSSRWLTSFAALSTVPSLPAHSTHRLQGFRLQPGLRQQRCECQDLGQPGVQRACRSPQEFAPNAFANSRLTRVFCVRLELW